MNHREQIIVALDVQTHEDFMQITHALQGHATYVKVGMELFYTFGPEAIKHLKKSKFKIFLDLKLHDIPNTVLKSVKTLCRLGVDMLNVHAAGGSQMLEAAVAGLKAAQMEQPQVKTKLIAVTHLTSVNEQILKQEIGIQIALQESVLQYASLAKKAQLDGVVASAQDVMQIKAELGKNFLCVTPGIRPLGSDGHDQKRITTPKDAIKFGSDYLVIGRAITNSQNPGHSFEEILKEIQA
ncbi:MAG: orotidine-5'-phosphate decarboxylase [Bacteriovoracaceae bacterium]|nr:orotidine-5'-phosphate decarboxylase [Bacteriovoracaceae bacterium]